MRAFSQTLLPRDAWRQKSEEEQRGERERKQKPSKTAGSEGDRRESEAQPALIAEMFCKVSLHGSFSPLAG